MSVGICFPPLKLCFNLVCYLEAFKMGWVGWEWHQRGFSLLFAAVIVILNFRNLFRSTVLITISRYHFVSTILACCR